MKKLLAILLFCVLAVGMTSVASAAPKGINYNHNLFSLTLPANWEGRYSAQIFNDGDIIDGVLFRSIRNEKAGAGGLLFAIEIYNKVPDIPTMYAELAKTNGKYFYVVYPGDVPFAYENAELTKEYTDMRNDIESILKTFKVRRS